MVSRKPITTEDILHAVQNITGSKLRDDEQQELASLVASTPREAHRAVIAFAKTLATPTATETSRHTDKVEAALPDCWNIVITNDGIDTTATTLPEHVTLTADNTHTREAPSGHGNDTTTALQEHIIQIGHQNVTHITITKDENIAKPIVITSKSDAKHPVFIAITAEPGATATFLLQSGDTEAHSSNTTQQDTVPLPKRTTITLNLQKDSVVEVIDIASPNTPTMSNTTVVQHESSTLHHTMIQPTQTASLHLIRTTSVGSHTNTHLQGMTNATNAASFSNTITTHHTQPASSSTQLYKHILNDDADGKFTGRIIVDQAAQQTSAAQQQHTLLESEKASMSAQPELEIHADDVTCAHGATIGKLDEQARFYIESRGISKVEAEKLLKRAFTAEVIENIQHDSVKNYVKELL